MDEMRTRFLPKMTYYEAEEYLKRSDIIMVPFGTVEAHGAFPMDVENVIPEAFSKLIAEAVDGLVLGQLPYFFCGATVVSPGSVRMSISDGLAYLKQIAKSLLCQGFRRQIYISMHGPAFVIGGALVNDFFDETKCPIGYVDLVNAMMYYFSCKNGKPATMMDVLGDRNVMRDIYFGAYEIMGKKDELVIDPAQAAYADKYMENAMDNFTTFCPESFMRFAHGSASVGYYYAKPEDHGGPMGALRSVTERDELCGHGAEVIRDVVRCMDMPQYVADMRKTDEINRTVVMPKYMDILGPRDTY